MYVRWVEIWNSVRLDVQHIQRVNGSASTCRRPRVCKGTGKREFRSEIVLIWPIINRISLDVVRNDRIGRLRACPETRELFIEAAASPPLQYCILASINRPLPTRQTEHGHEVERTVGMTSFCCWKLDVFTEAFLHSIPMLG
jgi:hypothetical protein